MSFHDAAPCLLTFYHSNQSLLPFKFKIFVLNTSSYHIVQLKSNIKLMYLQPMNHL